MQPYGVNQLRKMFLEFFESKGHLALKSFSLVPLRDGTPETIFYGTGDPAEKESDHMSEVHPHRRY